MAEKRGSDRRQQPTRRTGADRRGQEGEPPPDVPERRGGSDRRTGADRRSGKDRRSGG